MSVRNHDQKFLNSTDPSKRKIKIFRTQNVEDTDQKDDKGTKEEGASASKIPAKGYTHPMFSGPTCKDLKKIDTEAVHELDENGDAFFSLDIHKNEASFELKVINSTEKNTF